MRQELAEANYIAGNPRWNGGDRMIAVSGCSGGGKSALLGEMAVRGYGVFPEPGRQIVKEEMLIGGERLPWTDPLGFADLCVSRATHFFNSACPELRPVFFDRSIIDAVTAIERLGRGLPSRYAEAARRYRYAPRVFMVPPWEALFTSDAERRHGFAEAVAEYEALIRSYPAWGYTMVEVRPAGVAERADFLEAALLGAET